jgi:hypothetical protein
VKTLLQSLDTFTRAYIECALWASNDESDDRGGVPLDENYSAEDIDQDTLATMVSDCERFQSEEACILVRAYAEDRYDESHAGHDFWLTRNRHGAGYWDGDLPEDVGEALTESAQKYGEVWLYVSEGRVYA